MSYEDEFRIQEAIHRTNRILEENITRERGEKWGGRTERTERTEQDRINRAFAYTIEAAGALREGKPGVARILLDLALDDISQMSTRSGAIL
jgi:hypothetical protein